MKRKRLMAAVTALSLTVGSGVAWAVYSWEVRRSTQVQTAPNLEPVVTLPKNVGGLYPGAVMPFKVEVTNPNSYAIRITAIEGHNPLMPNGCKDYAVALVKKSDQELSKLIVSGRQTQELDVEVAMKEWAPKECANQSLPLDVVVRATQAASGAQSAAK
jgi:hypothetical protein